MTQRLCISVTFLDPFFHGKNDAQTEWPPSPMRLFQALVAGARIGCRAKQWTDIKAEAFRWLESRNPPMIVAPDVRRTTGYNLFVPNNDGDKVPERQDRLATKMVRASYLHGGDTVYYLWPIPEDDADTAWHHAGLLSREARNLLALGWGIDQVVGNGYIIDDNEVLDLPGRRWRVWVGYHQRATSRIPKIGSLEDIDRVHGSFIKRVSGRKYHPPLKFSSYGRVSYISQNTLPPRPFAEFELPDGVAFQQEDAVKVAAMLRSLAIRSAQADTHEFPGSKEMYVAGHTEHQKQTPPRFSYLPLPSIGHRHADGMIRRLLVVEPFGGDGTHKEWARNRLRGAALRDREGNERGVLLDLWRAPSRAMVDRYVTEARTWSTVTPVVLPGFDDGKLSKAEKLFFTAVRQAELPLEAIAEVTIQKAPFWPGSLHPRQYFVPDYLQHLPAWHVKVVFREGMLGPLTIGAGRHAGLGILAGTED